MARPKGLLRKAAQLLRGSRSRTVRPVAERVLGRGSRAGRPRDGVEYAAVAPTLYTTGYEQHTRTRDLIESLLAAGVERLVDVRELPLSRRRGFSKNALAAALADAGIVYEHMRALGNPYRELYRAGRGATGAMRYRKRLQNGSREAVVALATSLKTTTCILCVEAAYETCHRAELAAALKAELPRLRVVHLA